MAEVKWEHPESVSFEHVNLSRASFLRTDMRLVNLVGVEWGPPEGSLTLKERARALLLPTPRVLLHDHQRLQEESLARTPANYRLVELQYRQLRINLEAGKQEVEAGHFYMGEMEMRRRNPEGGRWGWNQWGWKPLLGLYWFLANYGESFWRPIFGYLFVIPLLFAPWYLYFGFSGPEVSVDYDPAGAWGLTWEDFGSALAASLTALPLPLGFGVQPVSMWGFLVKIANIIVNGLTLALIAVALRRRFKR